LGAPGGTGERDEDDGPFVLSRDGCSPLSWSENTASPGALDLETGTVILIQGEQRITGGTGSLDGAKGSLKLSLIGDGPATYDGIVVL
jgi:hypothetical protein